MPDTYILHNTAANKTDRQTDKTLISWRLHYFGVGEKDHNQTPSNILYTVITGIKGNMVRRAAEGSQEQWGCSAE